LIDSDGVTINVLPDDVLLDIFLVDGLQYQHRSPEAGFLDTHMPEDYDFDAAIVHPDRVREISLFGLTRSLSQRLAEATRIQEPFPALTHLKRCSSRPFFPMGS
jgi:hypothetical protein